MRLSVRDNPHTRPVLPLMRKYDSRHKHMTTSVFLSCHLVYNYYCNNEAVECLYVQVLIPSAQFFAPHKDLHAGWKAGLGQQSNLSL